MVKSKKNIKKKKTTSPKVSYTEETLAKAIKLINDGLMTKFGAAKEFGIPRQTIQYRMSSKFKKPRKGPCTVLTDQEEAVLVRWIIESAKKGFPKRELDLISSVETFIKKTEKITPFKDGRPGYSWLYSFMKRHPEVSFRTPEAVTGASANVSPKDIEKWFYSIDSYLKEENVFDILSDPSRIFNGDETNFKLCPKTGKVLALRGQQNVYEVDCADAKAALTVMFTFSADGKSVPPMIIYPYTRIPREIIESVPDNWGIGRSDSGWMKSENFYEYIANIFIPYLDENKIKKPVILFLDGHKSHLTFHLSELCSQEQIVLVALYPNSTRILQPADISVFRPVKQYWRCAVTNWRLNNPNDSISKEKVAPILKLVMNKVKPQVLKNGFRATGLYPWNFKALDFSKCLGKGKETVIDNPDEYNVPKQQVLDFQKFRQIIGEETYQHLKNNQTNTSENYFENVLQKLYNWFNHLENDTNSLLPRNNEIGGEYLSGEPIPSGSSFVIGKPETSGTPSVIESHTTPSSSLILEVPNTSVVIDDITTSDRRLIHDESGKLVVSTISTALSTSFVSANSVLFPVTPPNIQRMPQIDITDESSIRKVLMWPETPKRKGKRNTERVPYVITSQRWKDLVIQKQRKKKEEEDLKQQKKKAREEKKVENNKKKSKFNKTSTAKQGLPSCSSSAPVNTNKKSFSSGHIVTATINKSEPLNKDFEIPLRKGSLCFKCGTNTHSNDSVQCDICKKKFHNHCTDNANCNDPEIDDIDFYICSPCVTAI